MIKNLASDQLFRRLDQLDTGTLKLTTPDGKTQVFSGKKPGETVSMELRDWRVISNMIQKGDIGFAEDYRAGHWDTDDLTALATFGLVNRRAFDRLVIGNKFSRAFSMLLYLLRLNSLKGSKKNIHAHYDLGNQFYKLWLDPSMTYSAAIFKDQNDSLEKAQYNKYDRILDCLSQKSGSLLEVGCGWGGFAERSQSIGDYDFKGITLSQEQHDYARQRLGSRAHIALEDYRHQTGKFDNIVSIEMFEAVGERYWPTYFEKIGHLLNKNGKAVIQTITINEQDFPRYRTGGDFIRSYIFPGGMLPSPSRFRAEVHKAGLKCGNEFYFGQDYARTLEQWLCDFDQKRNQVKELGFDDGFIRLWRFYLAACVAGFRAGRTDVMQVELSHA
jgi:cyclopropane-fatty-acyl-phospholipid synthase